MGLRSGALVSLAALATGAGIASANPVLRLLASLAAVAVLGLSLTLMRGLEVVRVGGPASRPRNWAERSLILAVPALVVLNGLDTRGYFLAGSGFTRYLALAPFLIALFFAVGLPGGLQGSLPTFRSNCSLLWLWEARS